MSTESNPLIENEKNEKIDESTRLLCPYNNINSGATRGYARFDVEDNTNNDSSDSDNNSDAISAESDIFRWQFGIFLAVTSGLLFTANNFLIQYFRIEALEILLVRSIVQVFVLGLTVVGLRERDHRLSGSRDVSQPPMTATVRIYVILQALVGAVKLYLNFACLAYLPLGDALTIIFTEPLFTMVFSCVAFQYRLGVFRIALAFGLLAGMILCVQPPFIFDNGGQQQPIIENVTTGNDTSIVILQLNVQFTPGYYTGVTLAVGCAICGSLCNILIKKAVGVGSSSLVFFAGIFGIFVSAIGCFFDEDGSRIISNFESMVTLDWILLVGISLVGISGYFTMTYALQLVSATSVSVLRAMEIIIAYICQILVMGQYPNTACIGGAVLVLASVVGIAVDEKLECS